MSDPLADWLKDVHEGVAAAAPRAGAFAQHVLVLPSTASTNDDVARAALVGAPEGYTVIAAEQTAGRGRRGASWHSPAAHGLYLSTLLRPDRWPSMRSDHASPAASLVTLMAGVAVASAVRGVCDVPAELKWPNDVMVRMRERPGSPGEPREGSARASGNDLRQSEGPPWRKLAGILAEGATEGGVMRTVVLGVGLNLRRADAPADVAGRMVALGDVCPSSGASPDLAAVLAALLGALHAGSGRLSRGEFAGVRADWRHLAPSVDGTWVRWHDQGMRYEGRAAGIDAAGALRVRTARGEMPVHGGDVEWLLDQV